MRGGFGKCSRIRHVVRLRQMLLRGWPSRAASSAAGSRLAIPPDVPAGHVAVRVGSGSRRFVVPAAHLNHPVFRWLLAQAEEEFGFAHPGPLAIPCDEALFEEVLRRLNGSSADGLRLEKVPPCSSCCHAGLRRRGQELSLPLLQALLESS